LLNFDRIAAAPAIHTPFSYFSADHAIDLKALHGVIRDFPLLDGPGLFTLDGLTRGPQFERLVEDLRTPALQRLMEEKFDIDLSDKPLMITVRGFCQRKDGRVHVDSTDKVITGLLYLNEPHWTKEGGRLRLLRDPQSFDDPIAEIPPDGGTMLVFRRSEVSWHGHEPFEGPRRAVMFNWMRSEAALGKNLLRHRVSAFVKRGLAVGY
jgi:hypothetical protein